MGQENFTRARLKKFFLHISLDIKQGKYCEAYYLARTVFDKMCLEETKQPAEKPQTNNGGKSEKENSFIA